MIPERQYTNKVSFIVTLTFYLEVLSGPHKGNEELKASSTGSVTREN